MLYNAILFGQEMNIPVRVTNGPMSPAKQRKPCRQAKAKFPFVSGMTAGKWEAIPETRNTESPILTRSQYHEATSEEIAAILQYADDRGPHLYSREFRKSFPPVCRVSKLSRQLKPGHSRKPNLAGLQYRPRRPARFCPGLSWRPSLLTHPANWRERFPEFSGIKMRAAVISILQNHRNFFRGRFMIL